MPSFRAVTALGKNLGFRHTEPPFAEKPRTGSKGRGAADRLPFFGSEGMIRSILTFAAVLALGLGAAACAGKSETSESAAPAADQTAAAPDAAQAPDAEPAADQAAAPDANAPAPDASAPATEMAAAEPAPPPAQTEHQMLRDVRSGAHVSRVCGEGA